MKEQIHLLAGVLLAAALLFAGCSAEAKSETTTTIQGDSSYYGQVVKAVGNEITLSLGTKAQTPTQTGGEAGDGGEAPASQSPAWGAATGTAEGGGQMPEGEMPPDGAADGPEGAGPGTRTTLTLTGEERTLTIPVGVPVMRTLGGQSVSTTFTQITEENILEIVEKDVDGGKTVIAVNILS